MYEDASVGELLSIIDSKNVVEAQAIINDCLKNKKPSTDNGERYCWILLVRKGERGNLPLSFEQVMEARAFAESKGYKNLPHFFNLKKLDFSYRDFSNMEFKDLNFTKVRLDEVKFINATFNHNVIFSNSTYYWVEFHDSKLDGVDFSYSKLEYVKFINTSCVGTNFKHADLSNAKFTNVDFTNADISNADIDWSVLKDHKIDGLRLFIPSRFIDAINNNKPIESVLYDSLNQHIHYERLPDNFKLIIIKDLIRAINESALSDELKLKAFDVFHKEMYFDNEYTTRRGKSSPSILRIFDKNIDESSYQKLFREAKEALQKSLALEMSQNEKSPLLPAGLV